MLRCSAAPAKQVKKQRDDGEEQKQVNQSCCNMKDQKPACPQQQKNHEECEEHGVPP